MSERFHVNMELGPGEVILAGPEAHHLATVCRLRTGDRVTLFNGDGHEYPAVVREVAKREVVAEIIERLTPNRESSVHLRIAIPLPKGDRAAMLVEKLTELGVSGLSLLITERTVVQPREGKVDKLERYVIEASKQCGRNTLMTLDGPWRFAEWIKQVDLPEARWLAHPGSERVLTTSEQAVVAIGPEGGFSDQEVSAAVASGWRLASLGPRILRMETAAMAAAAVLLTR